MKGNVTTEMIHEALVGMEPVLLAGHYAKGWHREIRYNVSSRHFVVLYHHEVVRTTVIRAVAVETYNGLGQ